MATHFARGTLTEGHLVSARLSSACHSEALKLPEHRRTRFLASRALLAELLFMLYGTSELPDILTQPEGRPVFADPALPHFSIAYTGNIVGVALTTEGDCGLDMELQRVTRSFHGAKNTRSPAMKSCGYVTRTTPLKPERNSSPFARASAN
ncbi:protein YieE [Enterobacter hormaechei]|nr:protein YieE [Enterobacter hormaechei]